MKLAQHWQELQGKSRTTRHLTLEAALGLIREGEAKARDRALLPDWQRRARELAAELTLQVGNLRHLRLGDDGAVPLTRIREILNEVYELASKASADLLPAEDVEHLLQNGTHPVVG
jgi:hypothetical protein